MPPTITPPDIHRPRDLRENDSGRRPPPPPADKRTGGNGEGDNSNDRHRINGPRERLSRARIGIFFTLFVVAMLFIALISTYLVTRANCHIDARGHCINDWRPTTVPRILWLNTLILLASSITVELARRSMFREHELMEEWLGLGRPTSRRATLWLSITLVLGMAFIAGQTYAWLDLSAALAYIRDNPSSHFFYILTASHAVHLLAGIIALAASLLIVNRSRHIATRQVVIDSTAWYWHAMGALWLLLFVLIEFVP